MQVMLLTRKTQLVKWIDPASIVMELYLQKTTLTTLSTQKQTPAWMALLFQKTRLERDPKVWHRVMKA